MIRMLFIVSSSIRGGAQVSLLRLLSHLDRGRFTVMLCCPEGFLAQEARRLGLAVHPFDLSILGIFRLARLIRRQRFDVVKTTLLGAAVAGAMAVTLSGTRAKLIVTVVNRILFPGMPRWRQGLAGLAYHCVNLANPIYFTKSLAVKEELLSLIKVSSRQIHAIPNSIIFEDLPPVTDRPRFRANLGIKEGEIAIGVIGALVPQKGQKFLIEAAPAIIAGHPNVQFFFVGDGPLRNELEKLGSRVAPGRFNFLGESKNPAQYTLAMDIVVISSIFEGLPNTLLEALALGRPVVAAATGGCGEVIEDRLSGLLVKAGDAPSLAQGICWMLDHPRSAFRMGQRGEEHIRHRFPIQRVVEEVGALLEGAAGPSQERSEETAPGNTVLILISSADIGGAQTHVQWLAQSDLGKNTRMVVACPPGPLVSRLLHQGSEVYTLGFGFSAWFQILSIIRRIRPCIIHMHLLGAAFHGTIVSLLVPNLYLVYTVHNLIVYPGMKAWKQYAFPFLTRLLAFRIAQFIAVSHEIREFLVHSLRVRADKVRIIHNGISFASLEKNLVPSNDLRLKHGIPLQCPLIGTLGRITYQKGFDVLIETFRLLSRTFPTLHCLIVGDGELRAEIEELIRKFGLQERVHLVGFQQNILSWYRTMDIVVFPSRFEGLPITVIEAAYAGRAIIATDVGGMKEIIEDGVTGLIVPPGNPQALASRIRTLLGDPYFAAGLGKRARANAIKRFDVKRCSNQTIRVYEEFFLEGHEGAKKAVAVQDAYCGPPGS